MKNSTVLYVEDNKDIADEVAFFLRAQVKELWIAYDGEEGLALYKKHQPNLIITDIQMPKMNGIEMIRSIRAQDQYIPIIVTTAFSESDYLLNTINLQVSAYLIKPLSLKDLLMSIARVVEPLRLKRELELKNKELQEINQNLDLIVEEKTKELKYLYSHEQVTGLYNYITLNETVNKYEYSYLLLLDISNFSIYNKQYGKAFSNEILKVSARELEKHMRINTQLFKIESDKFVILTKEDNPKEIETFCEQIISYFDVKHLTIQGIEISINFAIGIEKIHENKYPLINAEYAIKNAKEVGGRFFNFYDEKDDNYEKDKYEIGWLNKTREMIQNNQIEAYYQPIMDIQTGKIVKYEVLARGEYNGKIHSPYYFIGAAEKLGIIDSITRIVINKSFHYFCNKEIDFSINITQRDLLDDYFLVFLAEKLQTYKIDASRVTLEVLESVTVGKYQVKVLNHLKKIKGLGFKIAIDDFGVEYSNFSRLLEMQFDYIKLDAIFVKDICTNQNSRTVVSAMVNMARSLGIQTIAEYVENKEILEVLKRNNVDMAQGFFIGKAEEKIIGEENF